jgi:hypothetical protein
VVRERGDVALALANAGIYLDTFGHIVIGWLWLRMAVIASRAVDGASGSERDFYAGKLQACRYFFRYELARVPERLALLASVDDTCLAMQDAWL